MASNHDRLPYEAVLRVIGRHLDAEPTYHFSILEIENGFAVRYQPHRHRSEGRTVQFTWERIRDLSVFHSAGRGCSTKPLRHQGLWSRMPYGHQDFFRSLGFALDEEEARSISLDELPSGLSLSYVRPNPADPFAWEKVHRMLREPDIRAIAETARLRRDPRPGVLPLAGWTACS